MPVASPFRSSTTATVNLKKQDLSSNCDGSTTTFTVSSTYKSGTIEVYWNGLQQTTAEVTESSDTTFTTSFTPQSGDNLVAVYIEK